jgi:hypothetical protein
MIYHTCPFDAAEHRAVDVPCAMSEGLPVGMMFVGRMGEDATILRAADAFERNIFTPPAPPVHLQRTDSDSLLFSLLILDLLTQVDSCRQTRVKCSSSRPCCSIHRDPSRANQIFNSHPLPTTHQAKGRFVRAEPVDGNK